MIVCNWLETWRRGNEEFLATVMQARAFGKAVSRLQGQSLSPANEKALNSYCSLPALPRSRRFPALREAEVWRGHWLLDMVLAVRVMLLERAEH